MAEPVAVKRKAKISLGPRKKAKLVPSSFQFNDLNDDCLVQVFRTCGIITLAKVAKLCQRFHNIITTRIIPLRTIDFSALRRIASIRDVFKAFGKSMTRIVIHQNDIQLVAPGHNRFAEFLRLLVEHGEKNKLREVKLTFGGWDCIVAGQLLQDVAPYFRNVKKMDFDMMNSPDQSNSFTAFFTAIDKRSLREVRLYNVETIYDWLSPELFAGIEKLHIEVSQRQRHFFWHQYWLHNRDAFNESRLINFLERKPGRLLEFQCIGVRSNGIFIELSRRHQTIERLGVIKDWSNAANANNNNNNNDGGAGAAMNRRQREFEYFAKFTNLKYLSLSSHTANFSDLGKLFGILAKQETIEELELNLGWRKMDHGNPVMIADLKRLNRLKTLHLVNFNDENSKEFVSLLFAHLPALTTCTIDGKYPKQDRIIELIKSAANLKVIKFKSEFKSFSVPFYKKLVKCREPSNGQDASEQTRLVVHIDRESAQKCLNKLGTRRYKPSIITLRAI